MELYERIKKAIFINNNNDNVATVLNSIKKNDRVNIIYDNQSEGCYGTLKTIEKGTKLTQKMDQEMSAVKREETDISNIILATNCGGSDATSGLSANLALGYCSDNRCM